MRTIFQTIWGLLIDDWWLGIGILLSIIITSVWIHNQLSAAAGGWLLSGLILCTLVVSLTMEYRRKMR